MKAALFSILTPVYNTPLEVLDATIASVLAQEFGRWELILVDDCSPDPRVLELLLARASADPRIKVLAREADGHLVGATNEAITAATGEFIALLDHDDQLHPRALRRNAEMIKRFDDVDYLYSDEDKIDASGRRHDAFRKPDWSPERLRAQPYTSHLSVARASLVREVGGFREGFDGSRDHDLILRVSEAARRVVHIPEILYHARVLPGPASADPLAEPHASPAGRRAVQGQLDRLGIVAEVRRGATSGTYRIDRYLDPSVPVSVVIATRGKRELVWGVDRVFVVEAVRSLLATTEHPTLEVVVAFDETTPSEVLTELREVAGDTLTLVPVGADANLSRTMNLGVLHARGDYLVLLHDDVEVISQGWLEQLVAPLLEADVGMTGGKLSFADNTIQHAGYAYAGRDYLHPFHGEPRGFHGPFDALIVNREVSGVTAACAAISREVFMEVGGFSEALPLNLNDVDLSYKLRCLGYRILWLPEVEMYHFESRTREPVVHAWEKDFTVARWGTPRRDAYFPHL